MRKEGLLANKKRHPMNKTEIIMDSVMYRAKREASSLPTCPFYAQWEIK